MKANMMKTSYLLASALFFCAIFFCACDRNDKADDDRQHSTTLKAEEKKHDQVKLSKEAIEENRIKIAPVTRHVLIPSFTVPARVSYNMEAIAHVGAPVPGRVADIKVRLGDLVKPQDELIVVESPDLGEAQSDLLQKRAAAAAAASAVEPAKVSYERGKKLFEQNQGIALADLQKREADFRAAEAAQRAADVAAKAAENKLRLLGMDNAAIAKLIDTGQLTPRYPIRAAIPGQVVERNVTLGALVSADKDLITIADISVVWVLADVPEAHLADVRAGSKATITLAAIAKHQFSGTISYLSPALDSATRTLQVRIETNNDQGLLKPGMFAQAEIEVATDAKPDPVLAIPDEAVVNIENESVVFIPSDQEGIFKKVEVKLGPVVGGWRQVLSGLKENDKVVAEGAFILKAHLLKPEEE
ncbi:MAG TPA: efflux RND transporter periplasmic adaptor subunit [Tepidisphaeraceae bacterium]|jgi:cobalt-zinc-cadmium efflux system membrane fusion protein|nr:efflux RND transporter periplasmic adaptor subunit [Tepidisphaeraceae bacterium]